METNVNVVVVGELEAEVLDFEQVDVTEHFLQQHLTCRLLLNTSDTQPRRRLITTAPLKLRLRLKVKVKFSHTRYRALGPELIPVYR